LHAFKRGKGVLVKNFGKEVRSAGKGREKRWEGQGHHSDQRGGGLVVKAWASKAGRQGGLVGRDVYHW